MILIIIGTILGATITLIYQLVSDYLKRKLLKKQLMKNLITEIEVSQTVANRSFEAASMSIAISQYLLTSNILDPVKDKAIIIELMRFLVLSKDYDHSMFEDGKDIHERVEKQAKLVIESIPKNLK